MKINKIKNKIGISLIDHPKKKLNLKYLKIDYSYLCRFNLNIIHKLRFCIIFY